MEIEVKKLIPSASSYSIYDHTAPDDLVESIKRNGVIVPIWITADNQIIAGHRRVDACKRLGLTVIPCQIKVYSEKLVIETNRYRQKTWAEKLKESEALDLIYSAEAKERQVDGGRLKGEMKLVQTFAQASKSRQKVAKALGTSHTQLKKVETIATCCPELLTKIDSGETTVNRVYNDIKRVEQVEKNEALKQDIPAPVGVYDVVVIDPPWPIKKIVRDVAPNQVAELDYPTMSIDEIKALEIPAACDCHLFAWTTHKYLPDTFDIISGWGFKYVCCFVWHKNGGFQPFGLPQYNCEMVIYCRKGVPKFRDLKSFPVCFNADRGKHSEKPIEFYEMIKRVTSGSRLDMFGRKAIKGFSSWGNEI